MIFSYFVEGPIGLQVYWRDGQPKVSVRTASNLLILCFMTTFVSEDCLIKGLYHAAMRFLMTHPGTVWSIRAPCRVDSSSVIWDSEAQMTCLRENIEDVAKLEDLFQVSVKAVKVDIYTLEPLLNHQWTEIEFDEDRTVLKVVLEGFTSIKTLDYTIFVAPAKRRRLKNNAQPRFDLKQAATQGHLAFQELKLVKCVKEPCYWSSERRVTFEIEDEHNAEVPNTLSVVTSKQSKRRLITKLRCKDCGQVLSK